MDHQKLLDMIPAYALGALDETDRQAIEALLAEDDAARQLLSDYHAITDVLVLACPVKTPPADLEDKLRTQLKKRRRPPSRRLAMALAAIFAVVIGVLILLNMFDSTTEQDRITDPDLYAHIISDPQAAQFPIIPDLSADIEGDLAYRSDTGEAVIRVSNLPALQEGEAFQLWLINESGATSGGVYALSEQTNYIRVPATQPLTVYTRLGVSIEPEGGSPLGDRPTGPRVFYIPIQPLLDQ